MDDNARDPDDPPDSLISPDTLSAMLSMTEFLVALWQSLVSHGLPPSAATEFIWLWWKDSTS